MTKKITALRQGKGRSKRLHLFLDGSFAFSLQPEVAVREGLRVGRELSPNQVAAIVDSDGVQRCLDTATHYLGYRPHSETELKQKLQRRGFNEDSIRLTIDRLKSTGLVDDAAFARFWKEDRESFRPRSQRLIEAELRQKGVAPEIINNVLGTIDDYGNAYRAALGRAKRLSREDYLVFQRRLGGFLRRRGFSFEVIRNTVAHLWQESGDNTA